MAKDSGARRPLGPVGMSKAIMLPQNSILCIITQKLGDWKSQQWLFTVFSFNFTFKLRWWRAVFWKCSLCGRVTLCKWSVTGYSWICRQSWFILRRKFKDLSGENNIRLYQVSKWGSRERIRTFSRVQDGSLLKDTEQKVHGWKKKRDFDVLEGFLCYWGEKKKRERKLDVTACN